MIGLAAKKLVVPFDFSKDSIAAVDQALEIADASQVFVLHVLQEMHVADPGVVWQTINDEQRCRKAEEAIRDVLSTDEYQKLNIVVHVGDPGHRVTEFASEIEADLIVMPSHGRRGISRLLIGSVAERVVRLAHCPVLVLRD